ncbi:MAG: hypothetical protein ACI9VR_002030 [Cognaticolwellia sp.]|jgi:hypothetical protein
MYILAAMLTACTPQETGGDDPTETGTMDTGTYEGDPWAELPRGLKWVRTQPMFLSGLTVMMDDPSDAVVDQYFDGFHANAAHFWERGAPTEVSGWQDSGRSDMRWLSWLLADGTSGENGELLGGVGANAPGRVGWQISDEPRSWDDIAQVEVGIAAVRAADPDALIVLNLGYWWEADADEATAYVAQLDVDVISNDHYSFNYGTYEFLERHRSAALQVNKPYWRYLKSYTDAGDDTYAKETDRTWNALVGMVYGYTGHTWFVYQIDPVHGLSTSLYETTGAWSTAPNARWEKAAELNQWMLNLGQITTQLTSTDVRYIPFNAVYTPDLTTSWARGAGGDPYIQDIGPTNMGSGDFQEGVVGYFEDRRGETYIMLQNANHESADWPLYTRDSADFKITFDFSQAPAKLSRDSVEVFDYRTGKVSDIALNRSGDSATLTTEIPAGEVFFFKYKTGAKWARQE